MNTTLRIFLSTLLVMGPGAGVLNCRTLQTPSGSCVSSLAQKIAAGNGMSGGPYTANLSGTTIKAWVHSGGHWKIGQLSGVAKGAKDQDPNTNGITIFYTAFGTSPEGICSASALGDLFATLAHELLHFFCQPHEPVDGFDPLDTTKTPTHTPEPDCNDLNYAMNAAKDVCEEIGDVLECLSDPNCEGIKDDAGNVIPGLERENLQEYCKALAKSYKNMQDRYNTPENAQKAFECNCGQPPWTPGASYPNCPPMPPPPNGCQPTASQTYPDNKVIPDCPHECPPDEGS